MRPFKNYYDDLAAEVTKEIFQELSETFYELKHNYEGILVKSVVHDIPQVRQRASLEY